MTVHYYPIGRIDDFPVKLGRRVHLPGGEAAVFRLTDGTLHALENRSPHPKGGTLAEGMVSGSYVFCPMRDWKISVATGEVQAPDEGRVRTYPVRIEDGEVLIGVEQA